MSDNAWLQQLRLGVAMFGRMMRVGSMRYRIAIWAIAGFVVMTFWAVYFLATTRIPSAAEPTAWTLARLTCPIMLVSFYFHFPVGIFWAFLANAATYALVGLIVESLRKKVQQK
jgi:hypothetical protein